MARKKKSQDFFGGFSEASAEPALNIDQQPVTVDDDLVTIDDYEIEDVEIIEESENTAEEPILSIDDSDFIFEDVTLEDVTASNDGRKKKKEKSPKKPKQKKEKASILKKKKKSEKESEEKAETKGKDKKSGKNSKIQKMTSTQIFSPIREVRDGIIITKDGRFIKLMEFSSINFQLRSEAEKDGIIMDYQSVIKLLPRNVQFKIISRRSDVSDFVEKIEEDMKTEKNAACRQLQREQIKLIRNVGAQRSISRRFFLIFQYENNNNALKHIEWDDIRVSLETTAMRIASSMNRIGNKLVSESTNEYTLSVLYSILCKGQSEDMTFKDRMRSTIIRYMIDLEADDAPRYLPVNDLICPGYIDTKNKSYMVVDGIYYAFAYVPQKSYPTVAAGGWLSVFTNLGEGIDVDLFYNKQDAHNTQVKLQYALRANKISLRGTEDTSLDYEDKANTVNSGFYLKSGLSSGDDFGYMSTLITVTAHSKEELTSKMTEIKEFCSQIDIPIKVCDFQHEQAFLSSLPICQLDKNIYSKAKRNCLGSDFAATYPFSSFEISDENGVLLGLNRSNNSLVFVDNFDSSKYANANMAILGMSGAGKTYTLSCIALRMREKGIQTFIVAPDKGHEFKRACDAIGGSYIKIAPGSGQNINIMELRPKDTTVSELLDGDDQTSILNQKIQQLHVFISLLKSDITYEEDQLLDEALIETYARFGMSNDNDSLWDENNPGHYKPMPVLGDLHETLKKEERARGLYNVLTRYVTGSASSFNQQTNVDLNNKFIILDVSHLTKDMIPIGMFIALDYVWDKAREDRTAKKAVFIDEVWKLLGSAASAQSAEFVLEIFKVIRGYGGAAIAATQDLNDFFALEDGRYGKAVINNSKIKFIMKLEIKEGRSVQEAMDLTDAELEECTRFDRGEGILSVNTNHVIIRVQSSQKENDLITTNRDDLARLAKEKTAEGA